MPAKSRLNPNLKKNIAKEAKKVECSNQNSNRSYKQNHKQNSRQIYKQPKFQLYLKHLPLLFASFLFFSVTFYILNNVYPSKIANFLLYNSYIPLLIPFFLANIFLFAYLCLNMRKGLIIATLLTILLFLKLQQFIFEYWWLVPLVIFFVIVDILISKFFKNEKLTQKAKFKRRRKDKT